MAGLLTRSYSKINTAGGSLPESQKIWVVFCYDFSYQVTIWHHAAVGERKSVWGISSAGNLFY